jgi:hypothetical protein
MAKVTPPMAEDMGLVPQSLRPVLGNTPAIEDLGDELCVTSSDSPPFYVFFSRTNPLSEAEGQFISMIVIQQERYIAHALRFLHQQLTPKVAGVLAHDPQLLFRAGLEFDIHFQSSDLPHSRNGVLVTFQKENPIAIEPIEDGDAWWDQESATWVPT